VEVLACGPQPTIHTENKKIAWQTEIFEKIFIKRFPRRPGRLLARCMPVRYRLKQLFVYHTEPFWVHREQKLSATSLEEYLHLGPRRKERVTLEKNERIPLQSAQSERFCPRKIQFGSRGRNVK
jgi:hypothetical protein